jgi:hypothetical protein
MNRTTSSIAKGSGSAGPSVGGGDLGEPTFLDCGFAFVIERSIGDLVPHPT